ncbi:hypothetical protein CFC21_098856 [Triticum aestivum]|uniref:Knl1 C-terminal RWD domain-containing protein n=3 Tax=Triticum TaxID=4564 RepID=A0A9R1BR79_TRITD|nr:uncharacterized protein LOC123148227 [Triticum aestivum]KAF7096982.1 hypothetical protein CFC21_098856 [Triticum aestivum]VAI78043.1 unnamed protein product [Triticum turgidum subsp. durum]
MDTSGGAVLQSPATEEETMARKRSRRVSFADTTAVHVFDRDEDFETPPDERPASPSPSPGRPLAGDAAEGDETEGEDESPFGWLGDVGVSSASPGSAAGSMSSFEGDDNFFGVVSASFIQSGRPSDSGMSEDNGHDLTLDSHTFSLHFNNVIPPDDCSLHSAGSLRTVGLESATPLKALKGSESVKSSGGRDALTDMSLCAENPKRYDYTNLSLTLNNLLQEVQEPTSPKDETDFITAKHALTLPASEKEHRQEKSYIGNGVSSDELVSVSSLEEHITSSSDPTEEDNAMVVDIHDKSQISLQENCSDDHIAVHPDVNRTVKTASLLSPPPPYGSFMSNIDLQPPVLDQSLSKDEPHGANQTASAVPTFSMRDAEQLHQQSEILNSETVLHTPKTQVQLLQITQGSVSSLRSKRQQIFSPVVHSTGNVVSHEASSLGSEFMKHGKRISDLDHVLKFKLHESPVAHNRRLPLVERNEIVQEPHNTFSKAEDHGCTVSAFSVTPQQLEKTGQASVLGAPPRQEPSEATEVQDTLCDAPALGSLANHECNSHMDMDGTGRKRSSEENVCAEHSLPEKRAKGPRSPITSRKQLPCVSLSSRMAEENQSEAHDSAQSLSDDWNKVVFSVSDSIKQMHIRPESISKLNLQQLDMLGDMLGKIHVARTYKRLPAAVRIQDSRLAEAMSLHGKLSYEKAKLQINHVKLDKLRNKAQLCQAGIQECRYLKSKISQLRRPTVGAAQMKGGPLYAETSINTCNRLEGNARITEKKLALSMIQQKVENLKISLEHFCNIKGDISEVLRVAEEQLKMRNQCRIINQQASLWELKDIVKRENKRDVILNYRNLLLQRIILNLSDMSTIFVSNSLMGTKIEKAFPNLKATVAFSFVFKAEENQRLSDLRSLQKKTMETSLLLGNLIDVLEEIEDAKGELLGLISADFSVDSQTGQLIFSLRFIGYKSAKRVAFTIDMTDLSRAVYPSEPSELPIKVWQAQTTLSQPNLDKLMASIRDDLQPGRVMILRLCRMVTRLVNTLPV